MISQSNTKITNIDEAILSSHEELSKSTAEAWENIKESLKKFQDLDAFFEEAADSVAYYFSIQSKYKEKEDFVDYLKWLLKLYVSYFSDTFEEEDEEIENIIEYIEDNYNFLLYHGENVNPVYKRINDSNSSSTRKQLDDSLKTRLINLLSQ